MTPAALLDDTAAFIGRYAVFPSRHALTALTLWTAHTHAPTTWYVTPRLILHSAEPGSGKTRVLELLNLLVHNPEMTISATVAAIFRMLQEKPYTLLFDEVDAIFNPRNGGNYEDLRGLLNAGYKRGATVSRCVGDARQMKVERFPVFAPVALAGLAGNMPRTITSRSVVVHMRRRAADETVEQYRERDVAPAALVIRDRLAAWVTSVADDLAVARPDMPDGITDRPAEVWEALLAVADAAEGCWPERARAAARHFVLSASGEEVSLGMRLLADLRALFNRHAVNRMPSAQIVEALVGDPDAPWADLWGKPLDQRRLGRELARYGVSPRALRMPDGRTPRGYRVEDGLADAWRRYLPDSGATSATTATAQVDRVAEAKGVADTSATGDRSATAVTSGVEDVADIAARNGRALNRWLVSGRPIDEE